MIIETVKGLILPFIGTVTGSALVFFMKKELNRNLMLVLDAIAAGVMCAASYFSLLAPALEKSESMGIFCFVPVCSGFFAGTVIFVIADIIMKRKHGKDKSNKTKMLVWAVTIHNIPEGMAVGVVFAAILSGDTSISLASAFALSLGIAIQNFPEGAIISMPLKAEGTGKGKAFVLGAFSAVAELGAALITLGTAAFAGAILPYALSFAAGAMFYVVVADLIPEFSSGRKKTLGVMMFTAGFVLMMALDSALG